jgi:signal peptidase II
MASRSKTKKTVLYLGLTIALFAIDQATKAWALATLTPFQGKPFIGDLLKFYLVWNDSAAFSISFGATWIFTIISSVATLVVIWLMLRTPSKAWRLTLAILLAGVVGNLADRLFREPGFPVGKVVDFLQLPFNFPIFNVADICITGSMTAVVILVMRGIKLGSK